MSDRPEKSLNSERIEAPMSDRKSSEPSTAMEDGMRRDGSLTSNERCDARITSHGIDRRCEHPMDHAGLHTVSMATGGLSWNDEVAAAAYERSEKRLRSDERLVTIHAETVTRLLAENATLRAPVPMLLWCPDCGARHIDVGEFVTKVHHTHACQSCGMVWRPAIVATVGVQWLPGFKND